MNWKTWPCQVLTQATTKLSPCFWWEKYGNKQYNVANLLYSSYFILQFVQCLQAESVLTFTISGPCLPRQRYMLSSEVWHPMRRLFKDGLQGHTQLWQKIWFWLANSKINTGLNKDWIINALNRNPVSYPNPQRPCTCCLQHVQEHLPHYRWAFQVPAF